jgi:phage shock protein E
MILIDVRTKGEYDADHIEGALLHDIVDMMKGVFPNVDKNEEITLYCESGNRSMMATNLMKEAGFKYVIDGGSTSNFR